MRGGFNVFDTVNELSRSEYGYGAMFEVKFSSEVTIDSAILGLGGSLIAGVATILSLMAF